MLGRFLGTTPKLIEPIDLGGIFWILIGFIAYIGLNIALSYIETNFGRGFPGTRVCVSAVIMFFPAYILFRGQQGLWLGIILLIPVVILLAIPFVLEGVISQYDAEYYWGSLLGAFISVVVAGAFDLLSESLASVPMSFGAFLALILICIAFLLDR